MKIKLSEIIVPEGRRKIDYVKVSELMQSIKIVGLLNPITVDKNYTLVAGEHRYEACKGLCMDKVDVVVLDADPPWQYGNQLTEKYGAAVNHYPTMSINELCEMPIADMTQENAVLFLWTTSPLLKESFEVIEAWGFKYKTSFIWDKVKTGMGHYNSVRHEFLLICTKGSCTPDIDKRFDSVQSIERSDVHSEKPEEFRQIIDTLYPHGKRIELFARKQTEGWEVFGNEV